MKTHPQTANGSSLLQYIKSPGNDLSARARPRSLSHRCPREIFLFPRTCHSVRNGERWMLCHVSSSAILYFLCFTGYHQEQRVEMKIEETRSWKNSSPPYTPSRVAIWVFRLFHARGDSLYDFAKVSATRHLLYRHSILRDPGPGNYCFYLFGSQKSGEIRT